ncbi:MAG: nodulation protein NfeD [Chloroflexota bacterium]
MVQKRGTGSLRLISTVIISLFLIALIFTARIQAKADEIYVLRIKGTINPVVAEYISRGIARAEEVQANFCIIQLDTPGGLDTAMRDIVKTIVNARLPVVVYVSPSGARAASAGVFITVSSHVAAMAPSTTIGAASPVSIGTGGEQELSETMEEKIMNDAAAYIRSLAQSRGRNLEWAEKAVREAVSATEQEALSLNVIELVSPSLNDLTARLDGREVKLLDGSTTVTLKTQGASLVYFDMTGVEDFLNTIADPNIAFLLLGLAFIGILVEIYNPPLVFPGIIGAIAGLLAFYALGMLPVNYTGLLFILLSFGLFIVELFTPGFGLATTGGITALIIGSLILFKSGSPGFHVSPYLVGGIAIAIAAFLALAIRGIRQAQHRQPYTGREEVIGKLAQTKTRLNPEGLVSYSGEIWKAVSQEGKIEAGSEVVITGSKGLTLYVAKKK